MKIVQNLSAVSTACMMTKKSIFIEVEGFDECLSKIFCDVDYCPKVREKGYLIVYTPYAEFYHHESLSRGYEDNAEKQIRFKKEQEYFYEKWRFLIDNVDPYFNLNLKLNREDVCIR